MLCHQYRKFALVGLLSIIIGASGLRSWVAAARDITNTTGTTALAEASAGLISLPKSCGGGLPPNINVPACCIFGYVFIGGRAIEGAHVTITGPSGSIDAWTERGPDSPDPYYRTSLSDEPLGAQVGDMLTITAQYGNHQTTVIHTVVGGGQQTDIVLARRGSDDYAFDRQVWAQSSPGTFNIPYGIAIDGSDSIYVVDQYNARIQVFNTSGQLLRQWGSRGSLPGQFTYPTGIAVDQRGNVYVADAANRRMQKFSTNGTWLALWGTEGSDDGQFGSVGGVAVDRSGNVYVADRGNHRIQKFDSEGKWLANLGSYGIENGQFDDPVGVAFDRNGNLFVTEFNNDRVQKFRADGTWLATWGQFGSQDRQLSQPHGIVVDDQGNVYITEHGNNRVQKFRNDGTWVDTWGSFGSANRQFSHPFMIALDSVGNVYITDGNNYRIQKLTATGTWLASWGKRESDRGQLIYPTDVTIDNAGNLFVADIGGSQVQKFDTAGRWVKSWGSYGSSNDEFTSPSAITMDIVGNVYVADSGNHRIQKFNNQGVWQRSFGNPGSQDGQLLYPNGVAVDAVGNIYIADTSNHRIQVLSKDGLFLRSWGGQGSKGGEFLFPKRVAVDRKENVVYVADTDNHRIQKFTNNGILLSVWNGSLSDTGHFDHPEGLVVDGGGNVFVTDYHQVRKFRSDGTWLYSWSGGGVSNEPPAYPGGVAVDNAGNVYVADSNNLRIPILRPLPPTPPLATIVSVDRLTAVQNELITLQGAGRTDNTSTITTYEWMLDNALFPFATTPTVTLSTSGLTIGRHTITFRVRDSAGTYSSFQSLTIDIVSSTTTSPTTWTFLLYLAGDNDGAPFLNDETPLGALYRLAHSGPNPNVTVVALFDGPHLGSDTIRFVLHPNGVVSKEHIAEANMGDPQTLIAFIQWGQHQYPANHYYLAVADHANGLDGIAWDYTSGLDEHLSNAELRLALVASTEEGAHPFDVLQLDGCLMGLIENAYQLRGQARYLVTSQNVAWSAFAYDAYRATVGADTSAVELASMIADEYARQVSALHLPYTLGVQDLAHIDTVAQAADALAQELLRYALMSSDHRRLLGQLRQRVQTFDSNGDLTLAASDDYVDLTDWARLVEVEVSDPTVQRAAGELQRVLASMVVREMHASAAYRGRFTALDRAHGVAIYYPLQPSNRVYQDYIRGGLTFPTDTWWDEYLAAGLAIQAMEAREPGSAPIAPLPMQFSNVVLLPIVQR